MRIQQLLSVTLLSLGLLFTGCKPKVAVDETVEKNHQDTHKLELIFTPGKLEGNRFIPSTDQKPLTITAGQETGWNNGNPITVAPNVTYFLQVKHYNKLGELINREYATNGEDKIHQHFFIPTELSEGADPLDVVSYQYLDTEPWDAPISTNAKVIGAENPIGLKGAITFKVPNQQVTMRLRLLHARGSKFSRTGKVSPFYRPGTWTANGQYDLDLVFKVNVSQKEPEAVMTESELLKDVARIEVVAIEGHLHGTYGFHETGDPANQKYMRRFHKFVFKKNNMGAMVLTPDSDHKLCAVGGIKEETDAYSTDDKERSKRVHASYGFWIDYFNAAGKKITGKILGGNNKNTLQHFFTVTNIRPTFDGNALAIEKYKAPAEFLTYIYCDTDPLETRIKDNPKALIGNTNPIGQKGYMGFSVPRSEFTLNITLSDLSKVGKLSKGLPRPAYAIPDNSTTLLKLSLPVIVYAHTEEYVDEAETVDELTSKDLVYITSVAKAYNITLEQALEAYLNRLYNAPEHSDSGYWF